MSRVADRDRERVIGRRLSLDYLTVSGATPVEQVEAAAAAGFDSVGLRFLAPTDLVLEYEVVDRAAIRAIRSACHRLGIRPLDVEVFFLGPDTDVALAVRVAGAAAEIGASTLLAVIADDDPNRAIDRFAWLCDVAARNGMDVALEFMRWSPVGTIDEALAFIAAADRPNAGVCVDALHLSRSGGRPEQVAGLPRAGSFVQLSDAPAALPAPEKMLAEARGDRQYPGEGELWLDRLLDSMPRDMPISVEVPNRRHAGKSVMERASIAGGALRAFLARESEPVRGTIR
jgi:sugar phosphate isomerase/epimerase